MTTSHDVKTATVIPLHQVFSDRLHAVMQQSSFSDAVLLTARTQFQSFPNLQSDVGRPLTFRMVLFETYLFHLHLRTELFGLGQGANFNEMLAFATKLGVCGSRTVSDVIKRMVECGRLEQVTDSQDMRVRRLVPTDLFMTSQRALAAPYLSGLSRLRSGRADIDEVASDPLSFKFFRYYVGKAYGEGVDPIRPFGMPTPFLSTRLGGTDILCYLMVSNLETFGSLVADTPFTINLSFIADVLETSRSHIRNVLLGLVERELITFEMQHSRITISPELLKTYSLGMACVFILYDMALGKAFADVSARRGALYSARA